MNPEVSAPGGLDQAATRRARTSKGLTDMPTPDRSELTPWKKVMR
jgi:hypothetical protein